jgi:N-acetylglucosaminyldiphosphoundecaprenol N-acetyl-beta-D-mannosaminyltransferase
MTGFLETSSTAWSTDGCAPQIAPVFVRKDPADDASGIIAERTAERHSGSDWPRPVRQRLFGIAIDPLDMRGAIDQIERWLADRSTCRYVVTPNVDHIVRLEDDAAFRAAYAAADLVLADGHPLVWASRLVGRPVPERVPGSDLVPRLFANAQAAGRQLRVFLLGAAPGVAQQAAHRIRRDWPIVNVVGTCSPPLGFEHDREENTRILEEIAACAPNVVVVGLGAPKQECWVHRHRGAIRAPVVLCVGATIDFLAGHRRRAPRWMQRLGVEWLYRLLTEPRRLARRYARGAWRFPQIVWRQWAKRKDAEGTEGS